MHDLKPSTNNACAFEQRNNLLGRRIGGNVKVFRALS
jgi:hypothetical protein